MSGKPSSMDLSAMSDSIKKGGAMPPPFLLNVRYKVQRNAKIGHD